MGCGIHAYLEIKVDDTWHHFSNINIRRNYEVFSRMAGVRSYRNSPEPIVEPRGLPEDISLVVALHRDFWESDGHTYSWLTLAEFVKIIKELELDDISYPKDCCWCRSFEYFFENSVSSFLHSPEEYPRIQDVRLVFWFDN